MADPFAGNPEAAKLAALFSLYFGAETEEELAHAKKAGPQIAAMSDQDVHSAASKPKARTKHDVMLELFLNAETEEDLAQARELAPHLESMSDEEFTALITPDEPPVGEVLRHMRT